MDSLNLEILPLTDASPYNVIHGCAKLINRRQLFEPNRLRDENRSEEERVNTHATNIQKYLSQPGSTVYYARNKPSDEVVGWIGWLRPSLTSHFLPEANNQKEAIDSTVDKEKDMDAIKSVAGEKKSLEKKFFGDEPFCTLSYVFVTPKHRRAGIGTKLVQHFLAILKEQDPEAKVGFTSSPTARFMYEKQGFRVVSWFNYTFEDTDDEGRPYKHRTRWPYMTNTYQTQSPQLDLHRLASRQAYDGPADGDPEITEGL